MIERSTLRVVTFPADDDAFRREVETALVDLVDAGPLEAQRVVLEERLRTWYRSVQVRRRDSLGGYAGDLGEVWYVYRDGRIRPRNDVLERLYRAMADARATYRTSERALGDARSQTGLAGCVGDAPTAGPSGPNPRHRAASSRIVRTPNSDSDE